MTETRETLRATVVILLTVLAAIVVVVSLITATRDADVRRLEMFITNCQQVVELTRRQCVLLYNLTGMK